jgi:hypothetical protein
MLEQEEAVHASTGSAQNLHFWSDFGSKNDPLRPDWKAWRHARHVQPAFKPGILKLRRRTRRCDDTWHPSD